MRIAHLALRLASSVALDIFRIAHLALVFEFVNHPMLLSAVSVTCKYALHALTCIVLFSLALRLFVVIGLSVQA